MPEDDASSLLKSPLQPPRPSIDAPAPPPDQGDPDAKSGRDARRKERKQRRAEEDSPDKVPSRRAARKQVLVESSTKSHNGALEPMATSAPVTVARLPSAAKRKEVASGARRLSAHASSSQLENKHATEKWPPGRAQVDNFIANVVPDGAEGDAARKWYRETYQSEPKARKRTLSARFPYDPVKFGGASGDTLEFVIVRDQKKRGGEGGAAEGKRGKEASEEAALYNVHLLRYFVEAVWKLPRPDVIISVTGGAMAFDLPTMHKDMIMKGMMENTRDMQPLFITGGTNAGILRCASH